MLKIVCGLLLSVSIGGFIAMIVTSGFRKTFIKFLIGTPLSLAIGFGIIGISEMEYKLMLNSIIMAIVNVVENGTYLM